MNIVFDENKASDIALKILKNIYVLNRLGKHISFSKNTNTNITMEGIQSYLLRHYYILNLLMLNKSVTEDFILGFYLHLGNEDGETSKETVEKQLYANLHYLKDRTWQWNDIDYKGILKKNVGGYFGSEATYEITRTGVKYLKKINEQLVFPDCVNKLTSEEYDIISSYKNRRKAVNNHSIFTMNMVAGVLNQIDVSELDDFAVEAGRGDNYKIEKERRSDVFKIPDASFRYGTSNILSAHVSLEADLLNETGSDFLNKLTDDITYSDKQTRRFAQFPGTTIYVLGTNPRVVVTKSTKQKSAIKGSIPDELRKNIEWCLYIGRINSAPIEMNHSIKEIMTYVGRFCEKDTEGQTDVLYDKIMVRTQFKKMASSLKRFEDVNGPLSLERYLEMIGEDTHSSIQPTKTVHDKMSDYTPFGSRRRRAFETLIAKEGMDYRFRRGHSLVMANYWELKKMIPSILPFNAGKDNVSAVMQAIGLDPLWNKFWPSLPLYKSQDEYFINMRNCFFSDGVFVSFEDISYDISALSRVQEYVSNPTGTIKNCMLCIIIDDDLTLASGLSLEDTDFWKAQYLDKDDTYKDAIVRTFGKSGEIPYRYRLGADFCFIKRSEYLSADPNGINPFLLFDRDVYYTRSTKGMEEDKRRVLHKDGLLDIALPLQNPENFKAYDYSFRY